MLSRDIRLSVDQIHALEYACRCRAKTLKQQLTRSSYDTKPGMKQDVLTELAEMRNCIEIFEVARKQIGHQLAASLGIKQ